MSDAQLSMAFFDSDTQVDFMRPAGRLYVPDAEMIVPNLQKLMRWADANDVPVFSSADAHAPDDPEFKTWPPHCVVGTPGQQRIPETSLSSPVIIPRLAGAFHSPTRWVGQFIVEKAAYDVQNNPNLDAMLRALGMRRFVVFGVATEVCVLAAVLALRRRRFAVDLVADAIKPISEAGGREAIEKMVGAGARMVTTEDVCGHPATTAV